MNKKTFFVSFKYLNLLISEFKKNIYRFCQELSFLFVFSRLFRIREYSHTDEKK